MSSSEGFFCLTVSGTAKCPQSRCSSHVHMADVLFWAVLTSDTACWGGLIASTCHPTVLICTPQHYAGMAALLPNQERAFVEHGTIAMRTWPVNLFHP